VSEDAAQDNKSGEYRKDREERALLHTHSVAKVKIWQLGTCITKKKQSASKKTRKNKVIANQSQPGTKVAARQNLTV
jgi:hypothetical protein